MESKWNETFGRVIFGMEAIQGTWSACQGINEESARQGARPPPSWGPRGSPDRLLFLYISIYPKTIGEQNSSGVPPPQASVATKNQSEPCSGALPEGGSLTGGHLHHPGAFHDEEGVVHPRGWGYVPVAMCLISLSLSHVLDLTRSWCIASFAIIVGSYDVFPPLLSCDEFSFPFEVILSDWVFKDLRTLDVYLACAYQWWQWDIHVIYLMYVLVINLRVPPMNLCMGVGTRFCLDSPVESLVHSLKYFVLVSIDESEIVWCISYNHTHGYLRWHWSI